MARDDEGTFLDDESKDDDVENVASIERGEEDDAANGNKSSEECDGEDMTMADHQFTVNYLLQNVIQQMSTGLEEFSTTNGREIEASAADLSESIKYAHEHALDRKRKLEAEMIDYQQAAQKVLKVLEFGAGSLHEIGFLENGEQEE